MYCMYRSGISISLYDVYKLDVEANTRELIDSCLSFEDAVNLVEELNEEDFI